ncbi:MAG TPA: SDR family oxidoreductase [Miltoncostaeaceae bacterium]|nr:SDR family oxidoreductase [Miltoncostaeaceae bacterium]
MATNRKPVDAQVIVITGATSGIGLATARQAAEEGARLVLVARDDEGLRQVAEDLDPSGTRVRWMTADVADRDAMDRVAGLAREAFGGVDTWVNNAGASAYGLLEETPLADAHRIFATNYWGVVNGALAALPELRRSGGVLINIGSVLGDRAVSLQGHYSASKHAVKGFTDALRVELERDGAGVAVTHVKPSSIATPYPEHAADHMDRETDLPPPLYAPEVVARAVLACAVRPRRDVYVGAAGPMLGGFGTLAPRLMDRYVRHIAHDQQRADAPREPGRREGLHAPARGDVRVWGRPRRRARRSSAYTAAVLHPARTAAVAGAAGVALALAALVPMSRR